jgi:hypothetical protein
VVTTDKAAQVAAEPEEPLEPSWYRTGFPIIRRVVIFLLGMAIMIDALWDRQYVVPELIIGMIMVGVLPLDEVLKSLTSKRRKGG